MAQVALWGVVAPVVLEVPACCFASSVTVDWLRCQLGNAGSRPVDFCKLLQSLF
jgi:hypothetical protein